MQIQTIPLVHDTLRLDPTHLIEIYEQYSPRLFRYAVRLLNDADLAEECVAETFSRFLQALQRGGGPQDNVQAYLYRMAHNWINDYYRSRPLEELESEVEDDKLDSPLTIVANNQEREIVRKALFYLTPEQRQVITLRFYENWPHEEIGALIGKTAQATRALQHRALEALRRMLLEQEDEQ
jgi:RNA polymerase sigma-70 factor, ECF subfamily